MAQHTLRNIRAFYQGFKVTGLTNQMTVTRSASLQENSVLEDDNVSRRPGLVDTELSFQGFWDHAEDKAFFDGISSDNPDKEVFSFAPNPKKRSAGDLGYTIEALTAESSRSGNIGEMFGFNLSMSGTNPLVRGRIAANTTVTTDKDGTILNIGSVGSDERFFASLHVTSAIADSGVTPQLDVDVESGDSTFSSGGTIRKSFSTFTDIGAEMGIIPGSISDKYWRASFNVTGSGASFDVFMVFGIAK